MTKLLIDSDTLTDIADAIREKESSSSPIQVSNMAERIEDIHTGGTPVSSITITNKADLQNLTLASDGTYTTYPLNVTVLPADAPQITQVIVSDTSVATVIDNGNGTHSLRVIGGGSTTVTVYDYEHNQSDSFTMNVSVALLSVSFIDNNVDVPTGGTRQMQLKFVPSNASDQTGTWSSNSQDVTVDQNGLVTATTTATASATITFTSHALGTSITATANPKTYDTNPDWADIQQRVANGEQPYNVGSELTAKWKDYTSATSYTERTITWVVMHYGTITDDQGNQKPGMYLQTKETISNSGTSFETEQRVNATEQTAQSGVYYYGYNGSTYTALNLQVGDPIPYELYTNVYKSGIDFSKNVSQISQGGLGWWGGSWLRQWLNSESSAQGFDWVCHHISDTNGGSSRYGGFLRGLDADFLSVLKPIKVQTARDNVICNQEIETTYDRIFLPSKEQVYAIRESGVAAGAEGEAWTYYVRESGASSPTDNNLDCRIKHHVGTTTARYWWLRSANRSTATSEWYVNSTGTASTNSANTSNGSYRVAPACVIY